MDTIKRNPGPAALTALGVTWLVMNGRSNGSQPHGGQTVQSSTGSKEAGIGDHVQSGVDQVKDTAGDMVSQVQGGVSTAADGIGNVADTAVQGAEAVVGGVADSVTSVASGVQSTVSSAGSQVKQMPSRLRHMVEENPMRLGLVGVALGSAVALAVPETRRENEVLGEARDSIVERAQSTAQTTLQKVQHVAEEAGNTVEKEAKYAGLTKEETSF